MRIRIIAMFLLGAALLTACGSSQATEVAADPPPSPQPAAAPQASAPAASSGQTPLGPVLVGDDGLTLYGFTNDTDATSTCSGTCAEAWPPVIVDERWTVAPGLDTGIFATTRRDDGQLQLVAGKWPLYYFAGDAAPGDVNGQGSGDVWFVVGTDGALLTDDAGPEAAPSDAPSTAAASDAPVSTGDTDLGAVLVDGDGLTLYGFTDDTDGQPTCDGDCADAWPPLTVESAELPAGLDGDVFSVVERSDGSFQLRAGAWPLYRFAGDAEAGEVNGQGSGGVWFAVAPDGSLLRGDDDAQSSVYTDD